MCRSPPTKEATTSLWAGPSAHGRGIQADVRRRRPWYVSDWTDGWNAKTTASLFYMFFTSIAPAITFADLLDSATKGKIGVVEVCLRHAAVEPRARGRVESRHPEPGRVRVRDRDACVYYASRFLPCRLSLA